MNMRKQRHFAGTVQGRQLPGAAAALLLRLGNGAGGLADTGKLTLSKRELRKWVSRRQRKYA